MKGLQNLFAVSTLCGLGLLVDNNALATLIYSEAFDYGGFDGPLAGKNGGVGFSGVWAEQNPGIVYKTASLSFSDLPVSGGSAYATGTDGIGNALLFRPFTAPLNGTYYGSFLSRATVSNSSLVVGVDIGVSHGNSFNPFPHMNNYGITAPGFSQALAVSSGSMPAQSGSPPNPDQVHLTLFKFDTVTRTTKAWVLTANQYDVFKAGGFTETELDAAAVGDAGSQVWAKAGSTNTGPDPIAASHLSLYLNAVGGVTASLTVDELRLSDASLDEVTTGSVSQPSLKIAKSGSIMLLVWKTNFPGFTLEQASDPNATNWVTSANSPIAVADSFVQPISMSTSTFFRLRKQVP